MAKNQRVPLSILDLSPLSVGMSHADALNNSLKLAQVGDRYGYHRYWMAEHHSSQVFMSSATSVLLTRAAERTRNIRIGAGGVMLPNQVPLIVAEHYGAMANMYPGRIDLGIGRAPGTDHATARALQRGSAALGDYAQQIVEIRNYLSDPPPEDGVELSGAEAGVFGMELESDMDDKQVHAIPGEGTNVPMWVLGSSNGSARVAALLGMPYSFASHFAAHQFEAAADTYRGEFDPTAPTATIAEPYVMGSVNVICADTEEEATYLASSAFQLSVNIRRGVANSLPKPVKDLSAVMNKDELEFVRSGMGLVVVGTPKQVCKKLENIASTHGMDELMLVTFVHDPLARRRSYQLIAREWGIANIMPPDEK